MGRTTSRASRTSTAFAIVLAATLSTTDARAEDPKTQAARSFHAGSEAYTRGDFRAAARAFDEAYRLVPRGAAAYNAGLAWESADDRRRAADDYTRALEASDLGSAERADATGRLRALESAFGRFTFSAPPGTRLVLDDVDLTGASTSVHVEPGKHALRVDYPGGKGELRTLVARAGVEQAVKLGETTTTETPGVEPPTESTTAPGEDTPHPEHTASKAPNRTAMWLTLGGAGLSAGVAVILFELGLTARNNFAAGGEADPSQRDQAVGFRTATWVAWSIAGGLAATGVVLYFTNPAPSSPSQKAAATTVALDPRGVTLRMPF